MTRQGAAVRAWPPPDHSERPAADLYEQDFHAWAVGQATLLRGVGAGGDPQGMLRELRSLDYANLAEELEGLANRDRRELRSRLGTIVEHLVKLEFSPARDPVPGWRNTVDREREEIGGILEASPSLRGEVPGLLAEAAPGAARRAVRELKARGEGETAELTRPSKVGSRYTDSQVLRRDFWPKRQPAAPSPTPGDRRPRGRVPG